MKSLSTFLLLAIAIVMTGSIHAQTGDAAPAPVGADTPPPGGAVITSDEARMDQINHTAVFTGNVLAVGTNFSMKCQEMTVNFDKAGKIDTIVSKGNVVIEQPGRITHSGQAEYYRDEDKFILTDQPTINDNGNVLSAPEITIYRTKQSVYTSHGRATTTIKDATAAKPSTAPAPSQN